MFEALRVHAGRRTYGHEVGCARARIAEGSFADGGAELVEERVAYIEAIENALSAQIAVRQYGGRSELIDDFGPTIPDQLQCRAPANALELTTSLRSGALDGVEQPVRAVDPLFVVVYLHAQPTASEWVIGVAAHHDRPSIFDRHQHRTGVRTVVRAGRTYHFQLHGSGRHSLLPVGLQTP